MSNKIFEICRSYLDRRARRGVTLLELMAVIIIVLLISTIVMRSLGPALKDRRLREGARMLNTILSSARNRAMQTGRPTGIWIDRVPGLPEAAMTVAYAQVPEAYAGEIYESGVEAFVYPDLSTNTGYHLNLIRSNNTPGSNTIPTAELWGTPAAANEAIQKIVHAGDRIRIGYNGPKFPLEASSGPFFGPRPTSPAMSTPMWVIGVGTHYKSLALFARNAAQGAILTVNNPTYGGGNEVIQTKANSWWQTSGGIWRIKWYDTTGAPSHLLPIVTTGSTMTSTSGNTLPFQILRQPIRNSAGGIQLPEGVIIDLNYSGTLMGNSGFLPFHLRYDPADLNYVVSRGFRGSPTHGDLGTVNSQPIILTFGPNGSVDQLNAPYWSDGGGGVVGAWRWGNNTAVNMAVFMIGSASKVPLYPDPSIPPDYSITGQMDANWTDIQNLFVGVTIDTGYVMTAEMVSPFVAGGTPRVMAPAALGAPGNVTCTSANCGLFIREYIGGGSNFVGMTNLLRQRRVMGGRR